MQVPIRKSDGTLHLLSMPANSTVRELRERIADELQIPIAVQTLVDPAGAILSGQDDLLLNDTVHSHELTLVISLEEICSNLERGVSVQSALETIAQMPHLCYGNERIITAVSAQLEHQNWHVRSAAVSGLSQIAEKGDQHAIAAVAARLEHWDKDVRCAAVDALAEIAEK